MKIQSFLTVLVIFSGLMLGTAIAEDNPEALVKAVAEATETAPAPKQSAEQRWQTFLDKKGWSAGLSASGVIFIPERELIISFGTAYTKVRLGQPGWIESRTAAFEIAEMEAKTKIIRYLSESIESKRSLSIMEHAVWQDDEVNKVQSLNEVADTLDRINKKTLALAEGTLDDALRKLDPEYDPARYQGKTVEDLQLITQDLFNRQIKAVAMGTLIGVTPLYSTEEKLKNNEYQALVGVIWSPKLNRLAMSLFNDQYNIPLVKPSTPLIQQIPTDELTLLGVAGTRIVIDENGQYAVMAYGQAQPRRSAVGRQQAALHQAKQIAANRARGQLVNFIREGITLRDSEISRELSQEFSDMTFGAETVRDYRKIIKGKKVKVKLSGLRVLKEWSLKHPATGQEVAGAVVVWSPASANLSKQAAAVMKGRPASEPASSGKAGEQNLPIIESMPVDTSAY